MKEYLVECYYDNRDQYLGVEPHSTVSDNYTNVYCPAETAAEAIDLTIDAMVDNISRDGTRCRRVDDSIIVLDAADNVIGHYYNFTANTVRGE